MTLGRSSASSIRIEIEWRVASPRSRTIISRITSFTSTSSRCSAPFLNSKLILPIMSAARVASLTILDAASLASATSGASRPSHRKQVLAFVTAAEIGCLISAAVTNARTCLRWLGREAPDVAEASEAASRIVKDATRAADIIGRISLLFKKGALQRELVDVNDVIREMIVLLRGEATRHSISIRIELAEDLPKVMADPVQLQQVFMNLMLNAIEAMKEGSGGSELTIKSEAEDGQVLISVSDTGVGLSPEQVEQIFKAFFTTKDTGTGMGLPISRSIIESHGGRLWATGVPGSGATFQFTLPATAAAHA